MKKMYVIKADKMPGMDWKFLADSDIDALKKMLMLVTWGRLDGKAKIHAGTMTYDGVTYRV